MVSPHPKDDHPPSQGWSTTIKIKQKELYYRLGIWYLDLYPKIKTIIQSMVSHLSLDGHPSSLEWSPIIQNMATHFPKDYHTKSGHPRSQA